MPVTAAVEDETGFGADRRPPTDVELAMYRIASEAVGNAVRHSGGSEVHDRAAVAPHRVELEVADDGAGLRPRRRTRGSEAASASGSRRCAGAPQAIDAELSIDGSARGTRVTALAGMTIAIAIVDDHPMVTGGLDAALATIDDLRVVARGGTVGEARAILEREDIDVVLLDVRLEDGNGIQALAERGPRSARASSSSPRSRPRSTSPRPRNSALPASCSRPSRCRRSSRRSGPSPPAARCSPRTSSRRASSRSSAGSARSSGLATHGLSNKEIGAQIGLSPKTVETHLCEIYDRFGIPGGRVELSMRAAEEGWLEIEPPGAARQAIADP